MRDKDLYFSKLGTNPKPEVNFFCLYTGLSLLKFCIDLFDFCEKINAYRLYFVSREGIFLRWIFERFLMSNGKSHLFQIDTLYISRRSSEDELFPNYLKQFNLNKKSILIDIGWGGTIEKAIEKNSISTNYYYYGCTTQYSDRYKNNVSLLTPKEFMKQDELKTGLPIFEFIMTPPNVSTTLSYSESRNSIKPVFAETHDLEHRQITDEVLKTIVDFVSEYSIKDSKNLVQSNWDWYWNDIISLKEIKVPSELCTLKFDMGGYETYLIIDPLSCPVRFIKHVRKGVWIKGSLSVSGLIWCWRYVKLIIRLKRAIKNDI